jgi:uncharacterized protein (UPF0548 family)
MIALRTPSPSQIASFLDRQRTLPFTYEAVGATRGDLPSGFVVDRTRGVLGRSEAAFEAACAGLRRWQQFDLGWLAAMPLETPLEPGQAIAVIARLGGVCWLNACRIVYTVNDNGPLSRYGFAYGTLPDHAECGEERFLIEWNRSTDEVSYEILAFSRPRHPLARLGKPLVRQLQRRFGRDSVKAMQRL